MEDYCMVKSKKKVFVKDLKGKPNSHPDHSSVLPRLNRVQGQIAGISEMIQNKRYCPDIMTQLKASRSALKSVEAMILKTHLQHCVTDVFISQNEKETESKIEEIVQLFVKES
jgi:DNA-binding FrmR family transcriptional regulator